MRIIKPLLSFSLLANLILSLILIKLFLDKNNIFINKPELIAKVNTSNISEAKIMFAKIVKEEFEIGSSEIKLIRELSQQGFAPGWSYKDRSNSATFTRSIIACNSVWTIIWEVDDLGNLSRIDGEYRTVCL